MILQRILLPKSLPKCPKVAESARKYCKCIRKSRTKKTNKVVVVYDTLQSQAPCKQVAGISFELFEHYPEQGTGSCRPLAVLLLAVNSPTEQL